MADIRETYTKEFKKKTIEHMEESGKKAIEICRELGIPKSTLSRWGKQYGNTQQRNRPRCPLTMNA